MSKDPSNKLTSFKGKGKIFQMTPAGIVDRNDPEQTVVARHASAPSDQIPEMPASFAPHVEMEGEAAVCYIPHQIVVKPVYENESDTLLKSRARLELWKSMFR